MKFEETNPTVWYVTKTTTNFKTPSLRSDLRKSLFLWDDKMMETD